MQYLVDEILKITATPYFRFQFIFYVKIAAGSQTNKSSKLHSMTPELCKSIYQKTCLNNFRLGTLGHKKVLEKSQIGWR